MKIPTRTRTIVGLRDSLARQRPDILMDDKGYAAKYQDMLLSMALPEDFEADLSAGDGRELQTKFLAAHSSSGLGVNCFAPFRRRIENLSLEPGDAFDCLRFEQKCPTGLRGGRSPNLDVLLTGPAKVVGIESKFTEYLSRHRATFSSAYSEQIRDARREQGYFKEMVRLMEAPESYLWLDAAQLIKHAFGLARVFEGRPVSLLYLYWEPTNREAFPEFAEHRKEIAQFSERVAGSTPKFASMSYPELWASWRAEAPPWLNNHLDELAARYLIRI